MEIASDHQVPCHILKNKLDETILTATAKKIPLKTLDVALMAFCDEMKIKGKSNLKTISESELYEFSKILHTKKDLHSENSSGAGAELTDIEQLSHQSLDRKERRAQQILRNKDQIGINSIYDQQEQPWKNDRELFLEEKKMREEDFKQRIEAVERDAKKRIEDVESDAKKRIEDVERDSKKRIEDADKEAKKRIEDFEKKMIEEVKKMQEKIKDTQESIIGHLKDGGSKETQEFLFSLLSKLIK